MLLLARRGIFCKVPLLFGKVPPTPVLNGLETRQSKEGNRRENQGDVPAAEAAGAALAVVFGEDSRRHALHRMVPVEPVASLLNLGGMPS